MARSATRLCPTGLPLDDENILATRVRESAEVDRGEEAGPSEEYCQAHGEQGGTRGWVQVDCEGEWEDRFGGEVVGRCGTRRQGES